MGYHACLAGVEGFALRDPLRSLRKVGAFHDDGRVIAADLKGHRREMLACRGNDGFPKACTASEENMTKRVL